MRRTGASRWSWTATAGTAPDRWQEDLVRHFRGRNRAVCVVPYDPILEQGGWIDHTVLGPATRDAWLEAAAVIMEPFGQ